MFKANLIQVLIKCDMEHFLVVFRFFAAAVFLLGSLIQFSIDHQFQFIVLAYQRLKSHTWPEDTFHVGLT
jgi:hypothetical protein